MPFDAGRGGAATPLTTLDALAETLTAKPPPSDPPAVFRWAEHEVRCVATPRCSLRRRA